MCGIFGCILKDGLAAPLIHSSLKLLEYRGYDSAGEATIDGGRLHLKKDSGKISEIHMRLDFDNLPGRVGIGHTRWATHGAPSKVNAHPHIDCLNQIAVVHNGIIENFEELKLELIDKGHTFVSRTDTEVVAHLIEENLKNGADFSQAFREALKRLKNLEEKGVISPPKRRNGVNLHIHTSESFSIFRSPTEAAWAGYKAGLEVIGINDHYTISGHKEFREACEILGLKSTFSIEAMAMSKEAKEAGERYNDPKNPGRVYLCGKGVVHDLRKGSSSERLLRSIRRAFRERCEKMTEKVSTLLSSIDSSLSLSFDEVLKLTPRGNVTERHVAQAIIETIRSKFPKEEDQKNLLERLIGEISDEDLSREDKLQNIVRSRLLKAGGPAYVEEPEEVFPSMERMVKLFRDYGAIPTYPVLGNPITEKEENLSVLFDELEDYGIYAVEVIPKRNTRKRLQEILQEAKKHGFPVFSGTEHNTKAVEPLLDEFSKDPEFLPVFKRGAYLLLGHHFLSEYCGKGYLREDGRLTFEDRKTGISFFSFVGKITWQDETLKWLREIGRENAYKVILGMYSLFASDELKELIVRRGFKVEEDIFKESRRKLMKSSKTTRREASLKKR